MGGNIQTDFFAAQDFSHRCPPSPVFRMAFWLAPRILKRSGSLPANSVESPMIQQRGTHFERVRHAHAIDTL